MQKYLKTKTLTAVILSLWFHPGLSIFLPPQLKPLYCFLSLYFLIIFYTSVSYRPYVYICTHTYILLYYYYYSVICNGIYVAMKTNDLE